MKLQTHATLVAIVAIVAFAGCSSFKSKKTQETDTKTAVAEPAQPAAQPVAQTPAQAPTQTPAQTQVQPPEQGQSAQAIAVRPGEPGGVVVQTYEQTATVTNIDKEARKVTLVAADGTSTVVKAGPEVVNFDQIQVGDKVKATLVEQLAILVRKSGETPSTPAITTVALAPLGAKPAVMMADTVEITGKVTAIDLDNHKATVQFPDGLTKTFKVRQDVDLTKRSVGEEVVIRSTEAIALRVEKP